VPYAVITRALDANSPYVAALATLGLEVVAMPVTRTAPPADPAALPAAIARGGYLAIVVASARAAEALVVARGASQLPEVWAVGPATARALAEGGIEALTTGDASLTAVASTSGTSTDGATLARAIVAARAVARRRILLPRAEDGRDELVDILRAAGAEVDVVVAYRTVATPADDPAIARGRELLAHGAAVCAVFAPSQVAALAALVPLRGVAARFVAIGETTADALRAAGVAEVAVAEQPTPEGLAKAVGAVYPLPS
jgi:uroporphyrinogen-III synthase